MNSMNMIVQSKIIEIWHKEIVEKSLATSQQKPTGIVLGGQPGAGKSQLSKMLDEQYDGNLLVINADDYRKYHPEYAHFQAQDMQQSAPKTQEFAALLAESILQKAIDERYNIVIEGTFKTAQTPIKTLQQFKNNAYHTGAMIQTCHKDISWASCLERYQKMLAVNPKEARYTPKEHHDLVVASLAKNIQIVYESQAADFLSVYVRIPSATNQEIFDIQKIYDSRDNQIFPLETIEQAICGQ